LYGGHDRKYCIFFITDFDLKEYLGMRKHISKKKISKISIKILKKFEENFFGIYI